MPRLSGYQLLRLASFLLSSGIRKAALLERRVLAFCRQTPTRRQLSRAFSVVLFGGMSLVLMASESCAGCKNVLDIRDDEPDSEAQVLIQNWFLGLTGVPTKTIPAPHPQATATAGVSANTASFFGNFTALTQPASGYFAILRMKDCSLSLLTATSSLSGSASITAATPNFDRTLHQLASLKTTGGNFANGCAETSAGISSRPAVFAGVTTGGVAVMATAQANGNNNGVFTLTTPSTLTGAAFSSLAGLSAASALATSDLNGDGNGDLVVVNSYNAASAYISVALGNADGTFATSVDYPIAGNHSVAAVIDDVNGDGKLDILAASDDQHISVLLGKGDGSFSAAQSFSAPLNGSTSAFATPILGMITADVNKDGKKDIICSNGLVLLGKGDGTFTQLSTQAFPYTASLTSTNGPGLASGDINKDGNLDLVLNDGATITVYLGKGDGTFTQGRTYSSISNSGYITVTDLDGDGNLDIYSGLANGTLYSGDDDANASAYFLMGNGDGSFQGASTVSSGGGYTGTNIGDVNGDGIPDIITNGRPPNAATATFTVQLGDGKGGFTTASTVTPPASFTLNGATITGADTLPADTYAVADVNGDGKADLIFVNNGLNAMSAFATFPTRLSAPVYFVALSHGDGTFATPVPYQFPQIAPAGDYDSSLTFTSLRIADINGDGHPDLIGTYNEVGGGPTLTNSYNQGVAVLTGNGDGTFSAAAVTTSTFSSQAQSSTGNLPQVVAAADLNGDSKPDLLLVFPSFSIAAGAQNQLQFLAGNGDGTFKAASAITSSTFIFAPMIADFNKDGKPDLAFYSHTSSSQQQINIALGNGDGTFALTTLNNNGSPVVAAADFNGDGNMDLYAGDGIFYGKGDGTFTSTTSGTTYSPVDVISIASNGGNFGNTAAAIDLNKDGKPDLVIGNTILINIYGSAPVVSTPAITTTVLTASASIATAGTSVALTATITPAAGSTGLPTGLVTFLDGTATLGTATLAPGTASSTAAYSTSSLTAGSHSITAVYAGDTNFSGSTSAAVTVTINAAPPADFTIALAPSSITVTRGSVATTTLSITPTNGFNDATALTCTGAPSGATCSIAPASVTPNGIAPSTATVTFQTPSATAMLHQTRVQSLAETLPFFLAGISVFTFRRRRDLKTLIVAIAFVAMMGAIGCGHSSKPTGTAPSTYTLTVTGVSGSITHSTNWTVTAQ